MNINMAPAQGDEHRDREFQTCFHTLHPAFSRGKNVVFTLLPGKIIRNVDCTAQEVEQGLARKEFSLLVNRKIQPFPPFSGKVAGGFQGAGKWDFRKK